MTVELGRDVGEVQIGAAFFKISSYVELERAGPLARGARRRQLVKGWKKTMGVVSKTFGVVFSL